MYLSAFLPVLIVLWVREILTITLNVYDKWHICGRLEWKLFLNWFLIAELCIIVIITLFFYFLLHGNRKMGGREIIICKVKNKTAEYYLSYYALFVLSLIGFSLVDLVDVISLCLLLLILGIVYIRNGMYYLNPTVNIFRFFIYDVEYKENDIRYDTFIISKEKLFTSETIIIYNSEYDFTFVKEKVAI
jgi:hypothetical protein